MNGFRTVTFVSGDIEMGGEAVVLRFEMEPGSDPVDLRLESEDLPYLVNLLLLLGTRVAPQAGSRSDSVGVLPLPIRGATLGITDDREPLLMFDVGNTVLAFGLPSDQIADIGRAILALSGVTPRAPS